MTKADLVKNISSETGIARKDVAIIVDAFLNEIKQAIKEGNHIELRQFGTFNLRVRQARVGRNPRTNQTVPVPERVVPTFKYSREFKIDILNNVKVDRIKK